MPIARVEGVTVREAGDGKRVRVLFTQQARAEVEKVAEKRTPYVEKVSASDNLRYPWAMPNRRRAIGPS